MTRARKTIVRIGLAVLALSLGQPAAAQVTAARTLPDCYAASQTITVALDLQVDEGNKPNGVIVTEDVPDGWTLSSATPGYATFDPNTSRLKWLFYGPQVSDAAMDISYHVNAPDVATTPPVFSGQCFYNDPTTHEHITSLTGGQTTLALCEPSLTAATMIRNPDTGDHMLTVGYDNGALVFTNWQGRMLQARYGFGSVTVLCTHVDGTSLRPRLLVGSTDSGGALRVIDPSNIHTDLAARLGFGYITAIGSPQRGAGDICVASTDSDGTLRKLHASTLADQAARYGFGQVTAIAHVWDIADQYLAVGSTDSGGTLRLLKTDTLTDAYPPRYGFQEVNVVTAGDADADGNAELLVASADTGGTLRLLEMPNLTTDLAARFGFAEIYALDYGALGLAQSRGNGKITIVVASEDGGGALRAMQLDTATLTTTLSDSAWRFGFGRIAFVKLFDFYKANTNLLATISADNTAMQFHLMKEDLSDQTSVAAPKP